MGRTDPGGAESENEQELKRLEAERREGCGRKSTMTDDPLLGSQQEVALEAGDLIRWIFACHF